MGAVGDRAPSVWGSWSIPNPAKGEDAAARNGEGTGGGTPNAFTSATKGEVRTSDTDPVTSVDDGGAYTCNSFRSAATVPPVPSGLPVPEVALGSPVRTWIADVMG